MVTYPIHVPRDRSRAKRGERQRKILNNLAEQLEQHINAKLADEPPGTYLFIYGLLAIELRVPEEDVRKVMFGVDGGSTGIRIRKETEGG